LSSGEFVVTATYEGKMDKRREQRIHAAFGRCGVRLSVSVEWTSNEDGTQTELTIYVDDHERAARLKSELRACGLLVGTAAQVNSDDHA
jgi:hypothetical protein